MTPSYRLWNARLLDYCRVHSTDAHGNVLLAMGPFLEAQNTRDAEEDFKRAVREVFLAPFTHYYPQRVSTFNKNDTDRRPLCAALLAATVLAAGEMNSNAYYEHLSHWLGCRVNEAKSAFLNPAIEESWDLLRDYFARCHLRLVPPPEAGNRYVKLPQQHALLRQIDIRRLADFFCKYNLSPRYYVSEATLQHHFSDWQRASPLTPRGHAAWNDPLRRESVLKQVRDALEIWDEIAYRKWRIERDLHYRSGGGRFGGSFGAVEAFSRDDHHRFDRIQTTPVHLICERGDDDLFAFYFHIEPTVPMPSKIPFGSAFFEQRSGKHFRPVPINTKEMACLLQSGYATKVENVRCCFRVHSKPAENVIFLFQNENGYFYEQARALRLGIPGAVLVQKQSASQVAEWLTRVCRTPVRPVALPPCLNGDWFAFADFTPQNTAPAPTSVPALHLNTDLGVRLSGGLRLAERANVWMETTPPSIHFVGRPLPEIALINETRASVSQNGVVPSDAFSAPVGLYTVSAAADTSHSVCVHVGIESPRLHTQRDDNALGALFGNFAAPFQEAARSVKEPAPPVLPHDAHFGAEALSSESEFGEENILYQWCLLGAFPGQAAFCAAPMTRARLHTKQRTNFVPIWAVGWEASGLIVAAFAPLPPLPKRPPAHILAPNPAAERLWRTLILRASPNGLTVSQRTVWQQYQTCARAVCASKPFDK